MSDDYRHMRATFAALVASMGAFLFGLDIGYIAPIMECASFKRDVAHLPDWEDPASKISSSIVGIMVGIFSIGCICTSVPQVSSYFLDTWGRRSSLILGTLVFLVGCCCQALAGSLQSMFVGRFITGCSIGLMSAVVPLYQGELAPASIRGALTSTYQLMITFGILVAAFLDMMLVHKDGGWRTAIWLQAIPASVMLLGIPMLPRSPRWLVQQGRMDEARDALHSMRSDQDAQDELKDIVADQKEAQSLGSPLWGDLVKGRIGRLVAIGMLMQMLQQLVGMNAFMYFGPRIFRIFGLAPNKFQTINNLVNFLSTFPALLLADRYGRRGLLVWSAAGMTLACFAMGILGCVTMHMENGSWVSTSQGAGHAMAACVFFFVMNFAFGWGPIVWVYCAEIFPLKYRGRCVGITTSTNWAGNYIIAQFAPMLLESIGFSTFFVFGGFSLAAWFLAMWLPETKGLMLEHISQVFDEKFGVVGSIEDKSVESCSNYGAVASEKAQKAV